MKRLLTLVFLIAAIAPSLRAQQGNTLTIPFAGVPTGSCAFMMQAADVTNGANYLCNPLTRAWYLVGSAANNVRSCEIHIGTPTGSALADTDDEPASCRNMTGATLTILGVSCYADAGTPTVTPILTGGAATSILTGALTCGTATWADGTLNGTPTLTSLSTIDANITTAGGVAKYIRIVIKMTL